MGQRIKLCPHSVRYMLALKSKLFFKSFRDLNFEMGIITIKSFCIPYSNEVSNPSYLSLMVNNTPPTLFQDNLIPQADVMPKVEEFVPVMENPVSANKKPLPACNGYHLYQKEIGAVIANMPTINPISASTDQRYEKISTLSRLTSHRWKHLAPEQKQVGPVIV